MLEEWKIDSLYKVKKKKNSKITFKQIKDRKYAVPYFAAIISRYKKTVIRERKERRGEERREYGAWTAFLLPR